MEGRDIYFEFLWEDPAKVGMERPKEAVLYTEDEQGSKTEILNFLPYADVTPFEIQQIPEDLRREGVCLIKQAQREYTELNKRYYAASGWQWKD